ncbi:hypothetical protein ACTFIZ_001459 [Dictyostelium cf. discoideum]
MGPKASSTPTKKAVATKSKPKPNHPTYQVMISAAIAHYKDRTGSSQPAIIKYIEANYNVAPDTFKTQLKLALKRLVAKGTLTMVKASYKLSEEGKKEHKATLGPVAKKPKAKTASTETTSTAAPPSTPTKKPAPKKPVAKAASTSTKTAAAKKNSAKVAKTVSKKPAAKKAPRKGKVMENNKEEELTFLEDEFRDEADDEDSDSGRKKRKTKK